MSQPETNDESTSPETGDNTQQAPPKSKDELTPEQKELINITEKLNPQTIFSPEWLGSLFSNVFPENATILEHPEIQFFRIENFLNETECKEIISLLEDKTSDSQLNIEDNDYRTSKTCTLNMIDDFEILKKSLELDVKVANCLNLHPSFAEGFEFEHFQAGEFFKLHTDFFHNNTEQDLIEMRRHGQRTWTFVIYLNDVESGGETNFPAAENLSIKPKVGHAVGWNNLDKNGFPNSLLMHEESPVLKGAKYILTKYYRDKRLFN